MVGQKTYPCTRCDGRGEIRAFRHVMGGVCLKCAGSGTQTSRPPAKDFKYAVFLLNRSTYKLDRIYNFRAKHAADALGKAAVLYGRASSVFRDEYTLHEATAIRVDELDDPAIVEIDRD